MSKKNKPVSKKESKFPEAKGVAMARKTREKCNELSDSEREELTAAAMKMIYGGHAVSVPADRT